MTTIAADFRRGLMCSDSLWTDGDDKGPWRKVHRRAGALIGLTGDIDVQNLWLEALKHDALDVPLKDWEKVTAIKLDSEGIWTWNRAEKWVRIQEPRYAIGTGAKHAIGAMDAGASVERAVKIAIARDANSGGQVRTYRVRK